MLCEVFLFCAPILSLDNSIWIEAEENFERINGKAKEVENFHIFVEELEFQMAEV